MSIASAVIRLCELRYGKHRKATDTLAGKAGDHWFLVIRRHHKIGKDDSGHDLPYATLFCGSNRLADLRWRTRRTPNDVLLGKVAGFRLLIVPGIDRDRKPYAELFVDSLTGQEPPTWASSRG